MISLHQGCHVAAPLPEYVPISSPKTIDLRLGAYAGQISKGNKPAVLLVVQASKFELVINLQAAKMLGFDISPTLLASPDDVIE